MNIPSVFLKNSRGEPDGMWTLLVLSFLGVYILSFFAPGAVNAGLSIFGACVAGYYGRKRTDRGEGKASRRSPKPPSQERGPRRTLTIQTKTEGTDEALGEIEAISSALDQAQAKAESMGKAVRDAAGKGGVDPLTQAEIHRLEEAGYATAGLLVGRPSRRARIALKKLAEREDAAAGAPAFLTNEEREGGLVG